MSQMCTMVCRVMIGRAAPVMRLSSLWPVPVLQQHKERPPDGYCGTEEVPAVAQPVTGRTTCRPFVQANILLRQCSCSPARTMHW